MSDLAKNALKLYEHSLQSATYQQWRQQAEEAWNFYDGHQWRPDEVTQLAQHGQPAIVINKIAAKVDNITGTEIASRTRILYRSRSGAPEEEATAQALSDLALYIAERNDQAIEVSHVFRAGLITGLGWLDVGVETGPEGPFIFNRAENELDIVWDITSRRADLSDAQFVARRRWLTAEAIHALFPGRAWPGQSRQGLNRRRLGQNPWPQSGLALHEVVEVQYRRTVPQYTYSNPRTGARWQTYAPETSAPESALVSSGFGPQVWVAYWLDDTLLSDQPLQPVTDQFTLIPYVYKRRRRDGQPYGMVFSALDPQRELNKRRSKAMHMLNTSQVIADIDAVEDPNHLAREAARPDGIILKRPGKELRILRNTDLASSQFAIMEQAARDIQDAMGVFDEALGKTSNAISGLAIQTRQMASTMNQMFAFDALRRVKKSLGYMILHLVRACFTAQMVVHITDNLEAPKLVELNTPLVDSSTGLPVLDASGQPRKRHDVKTGIFDIHVEEVRDALSSREHELNQLLALQQAGVPIPAGALIQATTLKDKNRLLRQFSDQTSTQEITDDVT